MEIVNYTQPQSGEGSSKMKFSFENSPNPYHKNCVADSAENIYIDIVALG